MIEFISPVLRLRIVFLQELLPVVVQHGDWQQFLIVHQMDYFDIHETLQGGCLCRNGKRHLDTFKTTWSPSLMYMYSGQRWKMYVAGD